jgi:hypothetical protein
MAVLDNTEAANCAHTWARKVSTRHRAGDGDSVKTDKTDTLAAFIAIRDWMNDNRASFNSSLPTAARTSWTAREKALALCQVIEAEYVKEG